MLGGVHFSYRWVESEATKDGVDTDISKYDGEWAIESPTVEGLSEDRGLVMKVNPPFVLLHLPCSYAFSWQQSTMQHLRCLKNHLRLIKII